MSLQSEYDLLSTHAKLSNTIDSRTVDISITLHRSWSDQNLRDSQISKDFFPGDDQIKGPLTLSMQEKKFSRRQFNIFSYFSEKIGFDISCKLSPKETICMKVHIFLFSRKNKKKC